uniref:P2X purinoreceptor 7 intracellular domain-containing protein n=1 Tax=Knipowitschia caucasica TaxID=637954 RepID=A0AAV2KG52_KNICA
MIKAQEEEFVSEEGEEQVKEGEEQVKEGEEQVKEGEEQVKEGEEQVKEGEEQVKEGEEQVKEGEEQIAYLNFRQEFGPLVATQHEQYRYTAYRQVVRWAYGILGRHIRKPIPSCIVSIIRNSFPEQGQYKGFQWANLPNYE